MQGNNCRSPTLSTNSKIDHSKNISLIAIAYFASRSVSVLLASLAFDTTTKSFSSMFAVPTLQLGEAAKGIVICQGRRRIQHPRYPRIIRPRPSYPPPTCLSNKAALQHLNTQLLMAAEKPAGPLSLRGHAPHEVRQLPFLKENIGQKLTNDMSPPLSWGPFTNICIPPWEANLSPAGCPRCQGRKRPCS